MSTPVITIDDIKSMVLPKEGSNQAPSIGQYAISSPGLGAAYSMYAFLVVLSGMIDAIMNNTLATTEGMAALSTLSTKASNNQTEKMQYDTEQMQDAANAGDNNGVSTWQAQTNTDSTAYGMAVAIYQGMLQSFSSQLSSLSQNTASLVSMMQQYVQMYYTVGK